MKKLKLIKFQTIYVNKLHGPEYDHKLLKYIQKGGVLPLNYEIEFMNGSTMEVSKEEYEDFINNRVWILGAN